jgi:hypothetical protein
MRKLLSLLFGSALATVLVACGDAQQAATTQPATTSTPVAASPSPEPGSASGESPEVTASSAAASAPECKDLEKADPKTCHPGDAVGDPNAK